MGTHPDKNMNQLNLLELPNWSILVRGQGLSHLAKFTEARIEPRYVTVAAS